MRTDAAISAAGFATRAPALGKNRGRGRRRPLGLAAAYHLARLGYGVEDLRALPEIGGMLRWAITEYRLPVNVLQRELEVFAALDVTLHTGIRLGQDMAWSELDRFDAVYLATGAWQQRPLNVSWRRPASAYSTGLDYLYQVRAGRPPALGAASP